MIIVKHWILPRLVVFGVLIALTVDFSLADESEKPVQKESNPSPSKQLMLSVETPYSQDLKALSELIVEPRDLDSWKNQGVVSGVFPSLFGKSNKRLPKFFVLNLFNPFAGKQYGYTDPVAPYSGKRPGRRGAFDVKTSEIQGVPIFGAPW